MDVLLVHSDLVTRASVARALARRGHRSVIVSSAEEGEAALARAHWDVVLMEFEGGDAVDFLRRARLAGRILPIALFEKAIHHRQVVNHEHVRRASWQSPAKRPADPTSGAANSGTGADRAARGWLRSGPRVVADPDEP
jgi:CheY-like chemotaxis protein